MKPGWTKFALGLAALVAVAACSPFGRDAEPALASAGSATAATEEYRLGAGDIISIRVYDWRAGAGSPGADDDLRLEKIRLDPSGMVSLPFGEFKAVGATVRELETALVASLKGRLLKQPRVWVNVEEYRPFFVEGQVGRPGAYPYQPGLNVRKAVTIAGGFKERASLGKIFLVRERDPQNARVRVDFGTPIGPGDTLVIEESLF